MRLLSSLTVAFLSLENQGIISIGQRKESRGCMLEYLHLSNVGPAPEISLDFAPRLNFITGDNGLGKSFILDVAWWSLTRRWPREVNSKVTSGLMARPAGSGRATIEFSFHSKVTKDSYKSVFDRLSESWTGRPGRPGNPGLVLYAQVDGSFSVWDPSRNYWIRKNNADIQDRQPAYVFSPNEVWEGLKVRDVQLCNGLLSDWALWQKEKGEPFDQLKKVLSTFSTSSEEELVPGELAKLSVDDSRWIPTLKMPYGMDVPVLQASAAMRRIISLAYLLVWSWQEHVRASKLIDTDPTKQVTFLIDEVECHLHPKWQRTIVKSLLEVIKSLTGKASVQVIAATHSPLLMASVEPFFDGKKDSWYDLDLVASNNLKTVHFTKRNFVRMGDVSNWLTSDAFDLKCARSIESENAIEKARSLLRKQSKPSPAEIMDADAELRSVGMPDIDPFWVRWSAFVESNRVSE